jgi:hypothetical protein
VNGDEAQSLHRHSNCSPATSTSDSHHTYELLLSTFCIEPWLTGSEKQARKREYGVISRERNKLLRSTFLLS